MPVLINQCDAVFSTRGRLLMGTSVGYFFHLAVTYNMDNKAFNHVIEASSSSWLQEHVTDMSERYVTCCRLRSNQIAIKSFLFQMTGELGSTRHIENLTSLHFLRLLLAESVHVQSLVIATCIHNHLCRVHARTHARMHAHTHNAILICNKQVCIT